MVGGLLVVVIAAVVGGFPLLRAPIKVGILHSLSGTMAISERALVDATRMAIDEINDAGGILGRRVEVVVADGKSNPEVFASEAERLIREEEVSTIFGCWTSACRRTVRPVIEGSNHLLFYPLQYEGLEISEHIVHLGATPNQQIIPAMKWLLRTQRKWIYLVGSDYVFPRVANEIIRDYVAKWRGSIVGEKYILLGSHDVDDIIEDIVAVQPDVIVNTINGDANIAFFKALRAAGVTSKDIPTISFSISEDELTNMDSMLLAGDFASWSYFQSDEDARNRSFVARYKARYGADRVVGDPMEAAYVGVLLWAKAVAAAGSVDVNDIRANIGNISVSGPGGVTMVDGETLHVWKKARIGQIRPDGQFDIVWESEAPIRPEPYPSHRPRAEWDAYLDDLYTRWGQRWYNPGPVARP
jgi:urea transport system substrate-binding protein